MNEWDQEDGFDDLDDVDREERDFARGVCRECETWGAFQCRMHADAYLAQMRAGRELYALARAARRGRHTKVGRKARFRMNAMWWAQ